MTSGSGNYVIKFRLVVEKVEKKCFASPRTGLREEVNQKKAKYKSLLTNQASYNGVQKIEL